MHISALHWKLGTYVVLPVHIGHKVCIMRFSSDWWAGMCSITWSSSDDTSWTHVSIISPIRSKCHPVVLALMICTTERCADFQSTVVTRLVCWGRWSSVRLAGSCIMFPHQLMMFDESILTCGCIGVMNIWTLYWNWADMLLRFHCTSVTWSWAAQRIPSSADAFFLSRISHSAVPTETCLFSKTSSLDYHTMLRIPEHQSPTELQWNHSLCAQFQICCKVSMYDHFNWCVSEDLMGSKEHCT